MITVLSSLVVLCALVFVHEFGHYVAARVHGVRVETFSIGMGPKLVKWRLGHTEFCLSAVPLGGYVRLAGARLLDDAATTAPDGFTSKSRWARIQVYVAGPLASVVFGLGLAILAQWAVPPTAPPDEDGLFVVDLVLPGTTADRAGFRPGDRIGGVGSYSQSTAAGMTEAFDANPPGVVSVEVERGSQVLLLAVPHRPGRAGRFDRLGLAVHIEPTTDADSPPLATLSHDAMADPTGGVPALGASPTARTPAARATVRTPGPRPSLFSAADSTTRGVIGSLGALPDQIHEAIEDDEPGWLLNGPIGLARLCGQAARDGWGVLAFVSGILSVGLGITNLLPVPPLDGGQVCILIVESASGRDAGLWLRTALSIAGLAVVIGLLAAGTYFDLRALW